MVAAGFMISLQDAVTKWLTGSYPVGEVIFIRSLFVYLPVVLFVWREGGVRCLKTRRPGAQVLCCWHCQTNLNRPAKAAGRWRSGRQLTPLGQGGGTVLSEDVAAIEVTVMIEMIVDRGVDGGKLLQSLHVPELRHRTLSSSERLM